MVGAANGSPSALPSSLPKGKKEAPKAAPSVSRVPTEKVDLAKETAPLKYSELTTLWGLGALQDLGPAAPATATKEGALFVTRQNQLLLAPRKGAEEILPVDAPAEAFAPYGRGPSVSAHFAYFISEEGRLLRASLDSGKVEALFGQARAGTRTSVVRAEERDIVAFVAEIEQTPLAYVWAEKGSAKTEIVQISPDGSGATSVAIVPGVPHPRVIVLAGRSGMSPVHARRVRVTKKRLTLEPDEVVWVGPGSHVLTEVHALDRPFDRISAFLPTAKDFNDFGLAQLEIESTGGQIKDPLWQIFKNGLDPAPLAAAHICGEDYVVFAKPTEKQPRSPQELRLSRLAGAQVEEGEIIARSRAFSDVSLAEVRGGALVVWTADHRTWGMVVTCPKEKTPVPK